MGLVDRLRGADATRDQERNVGARSVGGALRDLAFEHTWKRLFVYNILFEDAEVDERFLRLDSRSRVLSISGAGCGVAGMLSAHPASIDAVDINPHHLALAALKCAAAQYLPAYGEFYDLFGRGWSADPEKTVRRLTAQLPRWMQSYWRRHHGRFARSLYREGMTAQMLGAFRRITGVDGSWLRWAMTLGPEGRVRAVDEWIAPVLRHPMSRAWLGSPAQLVALGINYEQEERLLETSNVSHMSDFVIEHLRELARTDVATNWFIWYAIAGQFDHDRSDAVPPYLRPDRHARSRESPTEVSYHHSGIFEVLDRAEPGAYTHYTLLDAPDWLPPAGQQRLLDSILRTADDGAIVLARSVDGTCMVERLGMQSRFRRLEEESEIATREDRSRQYRRVSFYEVQA